MWILLGSVCEEMKCSFCLSWSTRSPAPDRIDEGDPATPPTTVNIGGLEPLRSPSFPDVLRRVRQRAPGAEILVETTGLPLLDDAVRSLVADDPRMIFILPLYGKDARTNEAVTGNPHFFDAVETLLAGELASRIRFQTLVVRANVEGFASFLEWARERRLVFEKYRVLLMRPHPMERKLYRSNVVSYPELLGAFLLGLAGEPVEKFDGCFASLPRCVLAAAGIDGTVPPWPEVIGKISLDTARASCPHVSCARQGECALVPDIYQELYGLAGIAPM